MPLVHKDLAKLDALHDHEDVTRRKRVEAHIKNQQRHTYSVAPLDTTSSPITNKNRPLSPSQEEMNYNEKVRQWNDTSLNSHHAYPSAPLTSPLSNGLHQKRRPYPSHIQQYSYRKPRKKVWNKYQRSKNKSAKQKQKEQHNIRHSNRLGMHLLEKFTSPNIEIDHITVPHRSKPRLGLFNKGKTSAGGKLVGGLALSEASFLGPTSAQPHTAGTNVIKGTNTEKLSAEALLHQAPSPLKDKQSLNEQKSCSSNGIYDFFEFTEKKSGKSMKQVMGSTSHTNTGNGADTNTMNPCSLSNIQQFAPSSSTQSPQKAILVEPDSNVYDNGQRNALFGSSEYQAWTATGRAPFGNEQQLPHYTPGVTPLDSAAAVHLSKVGAYDYATPFYNSRISEYSNNKSNNSISGIRQGSITSGTIHAWDSTSMINDPQHFRNRRSNIDNDYWHPSGQESIDPSLQPLARRGIFKLAGSPVPFRPNAIIANQHRPLYTDSEHYGLTSTEHRLPRLPPMKPIYNISEPMTMTSTALGDLHDAHNSHIISISSDGSRDNNDQQHEHVIDRSYRWQPNYQLNPMKQQPDFYYDQHQQPHQQFSSQPSIPLTSSTHLDNDDLDSPSPPITSRSHIIHRIYSPSMSPFTHWNHTSY